jgi:hypothetical protein
MDVREGSAIASFWSGEGFSAQRGREGVNRKLRSSKKKGKRNKNELD